MVSFSARLRRGNSNPLPPMEILVQVARTFMMWPLENNKTTRYGWFRLVSPRAARLRRGNSNSLLLMEILVQASRT